MCCPCSSWMSAPHSGETRFRPAGGGQGWDLLHILLSVEGSEESLDGASRLSSLRALFTHFLVLFHCWKRGKVIHYLVENILTFTRRQVAEIVRWCQLHKSVENIKWDFFFFFGESYKHYMWELPPWKNLIVDLVFNLNSSVSVCLCGINTSCGFFLWFSWN